jgi:hypothetical protein
MAPGVLPVAGQQLDAGELEQDGRQRVLLAVVDGVAVQRLEPFAGGAELAGPLQQQRVDPVGPAEDLRPSRRTPEPDCAFDRRHRDAIAPQRLQERDMRQRARQQRRLTKCLRELERGARVDLGGGHARCRVQAPRQALLDLDAERDVVAVLGQGGAEDVRAGAEALPVRAHPAEARECARPVPARRRVGDGRLQQRSRTLDVAGLEVPFGRLDPASSLRLPGIGRAEPASLLPQLGRGVRRATSPRPPGGLVERRSHLGVGVLRGQRTMPPPFLGIVQDPGEHRVQLPPARRGSCA